MRPSSSRVPLPPAAGVLLLVLAAATAACRNGEAPAAAADRTDAPADAAEIREDAMRRARVWFPPAVAPGLANLADNPAGGFRADQDVSCRFVISEPSGTTPKFNCELPGGETLKVKYGAANPELHAEVAASRLLTALGFGADRMFVVRRVRCAGCPTFPFEALKCFASTGVESVCFPGGIDYTRVVDFDVAVVERRLDGRRIEATPDQGWAWFELERIDHAAGGASRAEVDALRLVALLLAHWDNKAANQRLICLPGTDPGDGRCPAPLAIIQDLGATFGPFKLDLHNWRRTPIWKDPRTCTASMKSLPWGGGTFADTRISEEGRQFALGLLEQVTDAQLTALFVSSRITAFDQVAAEGRDARAWVEAWGAKVNAIRDAGPC
jgi:hypothetical protein